MGFQNIIKLLKSDKENLNYRHLKLKPLRYTSFATNSLQLFLLALFKRYCSLPVTYLHSMAGLAFSFLSNDIITVVGE